MLWSRKPLRLPTPREALPGRPDPLPVPPAHHVHGRPLAPPYPEGLVIADLALGCFWGAERCFWRLDGVYTTAVGYAGGHTPNPTYAEVCSGLTGHTEVVRVVFDPDTVPYLWLLQTFFEAHDPTQGMRQGNDVGTQYRSAIYTHGPTQADEAAACRARYQAALTAAGLGEISTELAPAGPFYFAEAEHQQYLSKHPSGYCGLGGTGIRCPG